jgi:hypothetical protein
MSSRKTSGGPPVDRHDDIARRLGDLSHGSDRRAALRQPGGDLDPGCQQDARETALDDTAGDLQRHLARRAQPADEERGAARRQAFQRLDESGLPGIAVNDAERRRMPRQPGRHIGGEAREIPGDRREDAERIGGQGGDHDGETGRLEGLDAAGADAEPDAADPVVDAGPLAQEGEDAGELAAQRVGGIDKAEIGALRQRRELCQAGFDQRGPRLARRMGGAEGAAHPLLPALAPAGAALPPIRRST